jgi:hypothetical protein
MHVVGIGAVVLYASHRTSPISLRCNASTGSPVSPCGPVDLTVGTYRADSVSTDCGNMGWWLVTSDRRVRGSDQVLEIGGAGSLPQHTAVDHVDFTVTHQLPFTLSAVSGGLADPRDNSHCSVDLTLAHRSSGDGLPPAPVAPYWAH